MLKRLASWMPGSLTARPRGGGGTGLGFSMAVWILPASVARRLLRTGPGRGGVAGWVVAIGLVVMGGGIAHGVDPTPAGRLAELRKRLDRVPSDSSQAAPALREIAAQAASVMRRVGQPRQRLAAAQLALRAAYTRAGLAHCQADVPDARSDPIGDLTGRAEEVKRLGTPGAEALGAFWAMLGRMLELQRSTTTPRPMRQAVTAQMLADYLQQYGRQRSTPRALVRAGRLGLAQIRDQAGEQLAAAAQVQMLIDQDTQAASDPRLTAILHRAALVGEPLGVDLPTGTRAVLLFDAPRGPDPARVAGVVRRLHRGGDADRGADDQSGDRDDHGDQKLGVIALAYGNPPPRSAFLPLRTIMPGSNATIDTIARGGLPRLIALDPAGRIAAIATSAAPIDPATPRAFAPWAR